MVSRLNVVNGRAGPEVASPSQLLLAKYPSLVRPDVRQLSIDLDCSIAAVTITTPQFVRIINSVGLNLGLVHRDHAFSLRSRAPDGSIVVEDAAKDARFRNNPYVIDGPLIRSYSSRAIFMSDGSRVGTICVADERPRAFCQSAQTHLAEAAQCIAAKLCFDPADDDELLSHLDQESLLNLLREEPRSNRQRLIAITQALQTRLDRRQHTARG